MCTRCSNMSKRNKRGGNDRNEEESCLLSQMVALPSLHLYYFDISTVDCCTQEESEGLSEWLLARGFLCLLGKRIKSYLLSNSCCREVIESRRYFLLSFSLPFFGVAVRSGSTQFVVRRPQQNLTRPFCIHQAKTLRSFD